MAVGKQSAAALQWVERLLEPSATEDMMIKAARELSQSYYSDVVDERNIEQLCGYPPCSIPQGPQPRQKYHISLAQKKVFDLTQRKKFCSMECYRASNYYASQLATATTTDRKKTSGVKLLSHNGSKTKASSNHRDASDSTVSVNHQPPFPVHSTTEPRVVIKEVSLEDNAKRLEALTLIDKEVKDKDEEEEEDYDVDIEPRETLAPPTLSSVGRLLHAMSSWCTPDTSQYVNQLREGGGGEGRGEGGGRRGDIIRDRTTDRDIVQHRNPPDEELTQSLDDRSTISSDTKIGNDKTQENEAVNSEGERREHSEVLLPLVHSRAHSQLQRSIFIQQLKRSVSSVAGGLGLSTEEILSRILPLVGTFRFSRYTVVFRPAEWRIIVLVLLQMVTPSWPTVTSDAVQKWLKDVKGTEQDLDLMLHTFTHQ